MWEVELKAGIESIEVVEKQIKRLGGVYRGKTEYHDIYYSHPCRDFKKTDELLRLRIVNGKKAILTYKGPAEDKMRSFKEEVECEVIDTNSIENLSIILEKLGFRKVIEKYKRNIDYFLDDALLTLTEVKHLGKFIEIELLTEKRDKIIACRDKIYSIFSKLGISPDKIETKYYTEMLEDRGFTS